MTFLDRPDRLLLVASLVFGVGFALVTPPFQSADEPAHFYRSYAVSEGRLRLAPPRGDQDRLPASLPALVSTFLPEIPLAPQRRIDPRGIVDALAVPLAPSDRALVPFPTGLQYTFVPYVPQALAIAVARVFDAPALALLYAARLANLLAGTAAMIYAVRMLPALRWPAVLLALMPMTLALRASASLDATVIAAAFLLTGAAARLTWGDAAPRRLDLVVLAVSAVVLCASKPPYAPLALLACLVPRSRWPDARHGAFLAGYCAVVAAAVAWSVATTRSVSSVRPDSLADAALQLEQVIAHPLRTVGIAVADYATHGARYLAQFAGHLGWLDVRPPAWILAAYLALLLALTLLDAEGAVAISSSQRATIAAIVASCMLLISASQYVAFTPLRADFIEGIQGRYFIALAPAGMWVLRGATAAPRVRTRTVAATVAVAAVLGCGIAVRALLDRFYGT